MKNQKGITLIALVITIIVLLILAGVSISMVIGNNGILSQASTAGRDTKRATEKEQVEMAFVAAKMKHLRGEISAIDATALATELKQFGLIEGTDFTVSKDSEILTVKFLKSGNEYPIENEIVKPNYKDDVVTPQEPANPNNGMYSVDVEEIAPEYLFNIEVLDEDAKTAKITGIKNTYVRRQAKDNYYHIDDEKITNTLVVPYEVKPEGKDELYTVIEVNLDCINTIDETQIREENSSSYDTIGSPVPDVKRIIYPNTVTKIGSNVDSWWDQHYLEDVVLPTNLKIIGKNAFSGCYKLTNITIPQSVTNIEQGAFSYCAGLTSVTIPSNVTSIGSNAFAVCTALREVKFEMTAAPTFGNQCFIKSSGNAITFYFKNSTVRDALVEGTHYNASYGTKSENYSW